MADYRRIVPPHCLRPWVVEIWRQRHAAVSNATETRILPSGTVDLVINRGDRFLECGTGVASTLPRHHLVGIRSRPLQVLAAGRTDLIVVRLEPWAVPALFGISAADLTDQVVDLHELSNARWLTAGLDDETGRGLVSRLAGRLPGRPASRSVLAAIERIRACDGQLTVSGLGRELATGRRQLARWFREQIGLGPKTLASIVRFQAAIGRLRQGESGAALALDAGYADQAHMIRDFARFAGITPGRAARSSPTPLQHRYNGVRRRSHSFNTAYL